MLAFALASGPLDIVMKIVSQTKSERWLSFRQMCVTFLNLKMWSSGSDFNGIAVVTQCFLSVQVLCGVPHRAEPSREPVPRRGRQGLRRLRPPRQPGTFNFS